MEENNSIEDINKVRYSLYDYQQDTTDNIAKIYTSDGQHNRFAGSIIPTGGGKSFIAIEELLAATFDGNGNFKLRTHEEIENLDRRGVLNSSPLLYVAPSHEILSQVKLHIVKNVLFGIPELGNMSVEQIDSLVKSDFPNLNFPGLNAIDENGSVEQVTDKSSRSEKVKAILRHITPEQIDILIHNAFPELTLKCYAGMKDEPQNLKDVLTESDLEKEYALIILDEAHRVGASEWEKNIKKLIEKNKKGKILAITATPERTDKDKKNMMDEIAKMVYPGENVSPDEYIAKEMLVLDAMRDGIVTSPKLIGYDPALAETEEYYEIRSRYETTTSKKEKAELKKILNEMHEIIGFEPPYKENGERKVKTEEEMLEDDSRMALVLKENLVNQNGKYIAFIPSNTGDKDSSAPSAQITRDYFEQWKNRIERQFKEAFGIVPEISFVTSNTQVQSSKENSKILKDFDDASNETGGVKILIAIDKLNEGVHVDGIDGSFMYRPIGKDSSTLFLQLSGRTISSMSKSIVTAENFLLEPRKQIFDFSGNAFKQINNNIGGKVSRKYDLEKIKELQSKVQKYNGVPNPNSNNLEEARIAIALRRISEKYEAYKNGEIPSTLGEIDKIKEIIRIADEMKLWDMEIPERTEIPIEAELTGSDFLSYTDSQRKFMELYYKAKSISKKREIPSDIRVRKLLNILKVLTARKPDIELPGGIALKETTIGKKNHTIEPLSLDDLLKANFEPVEIEKILMEFEDMDRVNAESRRELYHKGEKYDIGEELAFVRGQLWTSRQMYEKTGVESVFAQYSTHELIKLGIIDSKHPDRLRKDLLEVFGVEELTDEKGNIKYVCPEAHSGFGVIESIAGRNLKNGEKYIYGYDSEGYDIEGYDVYGYDRRGFNRDKTKHKLTGASYDDRGFKWDKDSQKWINIKTKQEYDLLGYNIDGMNEDGFSRPKGPQISKSGTVYYSRSLWHKKTVDGYERFGRLTNPNTEKDAHNFRYPGGAKWGYYGDIGEINTNESFWSNGATVQHPSTEEDFYSKINGLDIDKFDKLGFKEVVISGGKKIKIHRDTSMEYDRNGNIEVTPKNGRTPVLRPHSAIINTKEVLRMLVEENKTIEEIYEIYARASRISLPEAQKKLGNFLNKFVEITRFAPDVLEDEQLRQYLSNPHLSKTKKEQIHKFFEICPRFSLRIKDEVSENLRRIECLKQRELELTKYGIEVLDRNDMEEASKIQHEIMKLKEKKQNLSSRNTTLNDYDDPYDR